MFFAPSVGEVRGLSLVTFYPYMSGLLFLADDIVRGVVGLVTTMVSGSCKIPLDVSLLGSILTCGVYASGAFSASFLFNSLFSWKN